MTEKETKLINDVASLWNAFIDMITDEPMDNNVNEQQRSMFQFHVNSLHAIVMSRAVLREIEE